MFQKQTVLVRKSVICIQSERYDKQLKKTTIEKRFYISDIEYRATQFNQIIRQHWVNHSILFKSQPAVIHAVEGKDTETIKAIKDYLIEKAVIQVKLTKFQLIYRLPLSVDFPQAQKENLTVRQCQERNHLITVFPVLGEAYRLKKLIDDFWTMDNVNNAAAFLFFW